VTDLARAGAGRLVAPAEVARRFGADLTAAIERP